MMLITPASASHPQIDAKHNELRGRRHQVSDDGKTAGGVGIIKTASTRSFQMFL